MIGLNGAAQKPEGSKVQLSVIASYSVIRLNSDELLTLMTTLIFVDTPGFSGIQINGKKLIKSDVRLSGQSIILKSICVLLAANKKRPDD